MKKGMLVFVMLVLCLLICGCSIQGGAPTPTAIPTPTPTASPTATPAPTPTPTPTASPTPTAAPLSKHYETADELVADLVEINNYKKILDALAKNKDVHHFFSQNEADNRMWERIMTAFNNGTSGYGLSYRNIYCMYAVCNGSSRWFDALNINGQPFAVHGAKTEYASGAIPSKDSIINQIRNKFKDPYSVSIPGDMLLFLPTLSNKQNVMYPVPLEFAMWVGVRATNSFGAYLIEGVWLKVSNGKVTFYDSIAADTEPKDCSLRGFEDTIIRIKE